MPALMAALRVEPPSMGCSGYSPEFGYFEHSQSALRKATGLRKNLSLRENVEVCLFLVSNRHPLMKGLRFELNRDIFRDVALFV